MWVLGPVHPSPGKLGSLRRGVDSREVRAKQCAAGGQLRPTGHLGAPGYNDLLRSSPAWLGLSEWSSNIKQGWSAPLPPLGMDSY